MERLQRRAALARAAGAGLALCLMSGSAFAQWEYEGVADELPWPPTQAGLAPRALAFGQLTSDGLPDGLLLAGDELVMVYGATRFQFFQPVAQGVSGFALMRGARSDGGDLVLAAVAGGLQALEWDPGSDGFLSQDLGSVADWTGAEQLVVRPRARGWDFAAVAGDGATILSGIWTSGGLVDFPATPLGEPILGLCMLDWDGDPELDEEFAVRTPTGIFVVDVDFDFPGELEFALSLPTDGALARLAIFEDDALGKERLVFSMPDPGNAVETWLITIDRSGPEPLQNLGAFTVDRLDCAPYGPDAWSDLIITRSDVPEAYLLHNIGSERPPLSNTFRLNLALTSHVWLGETLAHGGQPGTGPAAQLDLDLDGDVDLVWTMVGSPALRIYLGDTLEESRRQVRLEDTDHQITGSGASQHAWFDMNVWLDDLQGVENATHLEVAVWLQDSYSTSVEPKAWHFERVDLPPPPLPGEPATESFQLAFDAPIPFRPPTLIYHLQFRLVELDAAQQVVWLGPTLTGAWSADVPTFSLLENEPGPWTAGPGPDDPGQTGGFNQRSNIRPFSGSGPPSGGGSQP